MLVLPQQDKPAELRTTDPYARWNGGTAAMSPLDEVLAAASGTQLQQLSLMGVPAAGDEGMHGHMLNSFGELGISHSSNMPLQHSFPSRTAPSPGTICPTMASHHGQPASQWISDRSCMETIAWGNLDAAAVAIPRMSRPAPPSRADNTRNHASSWEAFVARTPAIDFSTMHGKPPGSSTEICFGLGVQFDPAGSVASGRELVNAIVSCVAALPSDKQRWFIGRVANLLSPSLLGVPVRTEPAPGQIKKKLVASMTKMTKSAKSHAASTSYMASRKSQARFCVHLGLINDINKFNEDTLKTYLSFFKNLVPEPLLSKLAEVAGISGPPAVNLSDEDLQLILDELNTEMR
ncbi:hypothetical protein ZWY2020_056007 [Hordeum vulgare]|nr:hypothetical protein ZWY2020_056007 [Hordeum vulgare]